MKKEAILFIASTGVLAYFITPSSKEETPPAKEEQVEEAPSPASSENSDDGWDYDDGEDSEYDDEYDSEDEENEDEDYNEEELVERSEDGDSGRDAWSSKSDSKSFEMVDDYVKAHPSSPTGNELGSINNPIELKTRQPSNPTDD